jgi:defect-in-organelle-trafficking protein DotC
MGMLRLTYIPGVLTIAALSLLSAATAIPSAAYAALEKSDSSEVASTPLPPTLHEIQEIEGYKEAKSSKALMPINIRLEALKEAALSYGARGGLAARSYEIRQDLDRRASYLDKIFDFRRLLISAPSGLLIEPPIISESLNALLIEKDGQAAAVSDAVYMINENVRIVSAPRQWRTYLERGWGVVEKPPEILRPKDDAERKIWRELSEKGWAEGWAQADDVFEEDLNRLTADFQGMIRYRQLLAQGMVSQPFAMQIDRGVTGVATTTTGLSGQKVPITSTMRVGDRAVVITGVPELITGSDQWRPASR